MNTTEAAELLGMKPDEVREVESTPAGDLIVTRDGVGILNVSADQPDAAGQTGLMYVVAPSDTYSGAFPVYAGPADEGDGFGEQARAAFADPRGQEAIRDELRRVRDVGVVEQAERDPAVGGPVDPERIAEIDPIALPPLPDNSGHVDAGPSAASAALPEVVDAGEATTHPDPAGPPADLDPGLHDPAVGGPVDQPKVAPLAGDGPVGTAVIAEVPSGTAGQVLQWVGEDRGRAKSALAAERAATKPRSTLLGRLEELAAQPEPTA